MKPDVDASRENVERLADWMLNREPCYPDRTMEIEAATLLLALKTRLTELEQHATSMQAIANSAIQDLFILGEMSSSIHDSEHFRSDAWCFATKHGALYDAQILKYRETFNEKGPTK